MDRTMKNFKIIGIALISIITLSIPFIFTFANIPKNSKADNIQKIINLKKFDSKAVDYIEVVEAPDKRIYREGEVFDKTGMIVKAFYSDGTESTIEDYIVDKIKPLTIYDSEITVSYQGKEERFFIYITNDEDIEVNPNPSKKKYTLETSEGITRFEIEDSDISDWLSDTNIKTKIIERNDASNGTFLTGIDKKNLGESKLDFILELKYSAEIIIYASYSQTEKCKINNIDISSMFAFLIDENKNIGIDGESILNSRKDITKWQLINYELFTLPKGKHTISLKLLSNAIKCIPNIDYIDFQTKEIESPPVQPPIDEEVPPYDFHTLAQYQYITSDNEDPEYIYNFADGVFDLSRPRGNILDFKDSVKDSNNYVIQISSSKNFDESNTKIYKNLTEKRYIIKHLKLGQKIYYRGATNESELTNSKIYELTVNTIGPRNLDIPGVDNSRDIGGYKTTLVDNGITKQGLYFRTGQIDDINEEGKRILIEDLGIKVEIDLRDSYLNTGPYVDGIQYYPIPIPASTEPERFEKFEKEYYKVFNLIANADKNPIILHCVAGADRTGIMSFALMTLLGCEYKDIMKDYLFTNFSTHGMRSINSEFIHWWEKLDLYEGDTKADRCKSWLMSKGIEEDTLEHIRAIFIDNYKEKKVSNSIKKSLEISNDKFLFAD